MIKDVLISELKKLFPARGFKEGLPPNPVVVFPASHPEVGNVEIYEEGDGIIVQVGKISHGHFDCYDKSLSANQRNDEIIRRVVDFLDDLFSDKILLWASEFGSGGWHVIRNSEDLKPLSEWKGMQELIKAGLEMSKGEGRYFLWSGPVDIEG